MNDTDRFTDDDLALSALVDGALPEDELRRLKQRLADEPQLALRLEQLRRTDDAVRGAYGGIVDEPLPQRVTDLVQRHAEVGRFRPRAAVRRPGLSTAITTGLALAAGFLLAFVILPRDRALGPPGLVTPGDLVAAGSSLYETLQATPSSETRELGDGWSATPRLTFTSVEGHPCRRVDLATPERGLATLACRRDGSWRLELIGFEAAGGLGPDGVYRTATGGTTSPIDDAIDGLIEGAPLGREAERDWISRGWE